MITIEEKMKLFTKIIYDKVEKYNQNAVTNFNTEYGNIIEEKKNEFEKEAEHIYGQGVKDIQKEKLQILSKARVEEKKIILNQRKKIFEEMLKALNEYAEKFRQTDEYRNILLSDLSKTLEEMKCMTKLQILLTQNDIKNFSNEINKLLEKYDVELKYDNELTGGFIVIDRSNNIKIDMSIKSRIESSRDSIGEKLFAILQ